VNLASRHNAEVTALCRRFGVRRLELFGSGATEPDACFGLLERLETLVYAA